MTLQNASHPTASRARLFAPATTAAAALALALTPAVAAASAVKIGTPGSDRLKAKPSGSTLWGGGGADTLIGGSGDDRIYGVRSDNRISAAGGNDYIEGGAGSDVIDGGTGNNTIFGSSGQDRIVAGDGNNYVDVGGGNDRAVLGDGNNVLVTASGGGSFQVGNGNNTIYYGSGIAYITAGSGVNQIYLSGTAGVRKLECGGNPATTVYVNDSGLGPYSLQILARKVKHCPNITTYDGTKRITAKIAGLWNSFELTGGDGRDKLFGGHGGGTIDGGGGDNEIWVDHNEATGLPRSQGFTTRVTVADGNNRIFGGRGTNIISAGNGNNFVRAGAWINDITVGSGVNQIRLQGAKSTNTVTIRGRADNEGSYVESLANGKRPVIRCVDGAKAAVVYGNTKPRTNCRPLVPVRSEKGEELQIERTPGVPAADLILEDQIAPGEYGIGVPRPNGEA
ncbi:MAG: calcium-binding protein [Patulibacter sp.]